MPGRDPPPRLDDLTDRTRPAPALIGIQSGRKFARKFRHPKLRSISRIARQWTFAGRDGILPSEKSKKILQVRGCSQETTGGQQ
jgi:hypothetical protein